MKGQNFRQLYESMGPQGTYEKITDCLKDGSLTPKDFSLKELFIGCCGHASFVKLGERLSSHRAISGAPAPSIARLSESAPPSMHPLGGNDGSVRNLNEEQYSLLESQNQWGEDPGAILQEAGEAVDVSAFAAITGQIAFNAIGQGWNNAEMVGDRIFRNYPTPFSGEKIPWLSNVFGATPGDSDIHPQMPYPEVTLGPRYISTPRVLKKGAILSLSMEFILFDRTAQAMQGFEKLGKGVRYDKEYAQLRVFMGYNPTGALVVASGANQYTLNGTGSATYLGTGSNYVNALSGTPLVDWTSINQAIFLRSKILDPDTGRPIVLGPPKDMFVMPFQVFTAKRILRATSTQTVFPGYQATVTAPGNVKFDSTNPVDWNINLLTSPIAYQILLGAAAAPVSGAAAPSGGAAVINNYTWIGDFQDSFWYAETFPFRTEQAVPNNIRQFEQDIQMRWKISEMGVPFVYDPRPTEFLYNT